MERYIELEELKGIYRFVGTVIPRFVRVGGKIYTVKGEVPKPTDKRAGGTAEEITENVLLSGAYSQQMDDMKVKVQEEIDRLISEELERIDNAINSRCSIANIIKVSDDKYELTHHKFKMISSLVANGFNPYLVGGAGSGKSTTIGYVANHLGLDLYYNNSVQNTFDLIGYNDANGQYVETEFFRAFTKGGIFFLDEMDTASPDAIIVLNTAIANKVLAFPSGTFQAHNNFKVVGAGNTYGVGADRIYVGRNALDGATLDRFVMVEFDYDENLELALVGNQKDLYQDFKNIRKTMQSNKAICSTRALLGINKLLVMIKEKVIEELDAKELIIKGLLFKGLSKTQITNLSSLSNPKSLLGELWNSEVL